jgi:hypothetical protein
MQWDPVWRLYRPLRGLFPVMVAKGPRHSLFPVTLPTIRIVVVPTGVTVLLGLRNPPHSWTGTVGPSLPGFTISPCVDFLLCYRIDQAT